MQEAFEKIIEQLKTECFLTTNDDGETNELSIKVVALGDAIAIVKETAAEYNNSWISCNSGKQPEECPYLEHDERTDEYICHNCGFSEDTECPVPDPSGCPAETNIHGNTLHPSISES